VADHAAMSVELDTRQNEGLTVSLEWDHVTGATQIVIVDARDASLVVLGIPRAKAADAFRHPFRYVHFSPATPGGDG
jgi:hypothetical protein